MRILCWQVPFWFVLHFRVAFHPIAVNSCFQYIPNQVHKFQNPFVLDFFLGVGTFQSFIPKDTPNRPKRRFGTLFCTNLFLTSWFSLDTKLWKHYFLYVTGTLKYYNFLLLWLPLRCWNLPVIENLPKQPKNIDVFRRFVLLCYDISRVALDSKLGQRSFRGVLGTFPY